jgi:hypothetical protein
LWEIAARITDEELRHSFLENVAAHRELLAEYTRLGSSVTGLAEAVPPTPADLVGRPGSW